MSREKQVQKLEDIIWQCMKSQNEYDAHSIAKKLVDMGIGSKDRFELYVREGIPCGWDIRPKDYKENDNET